VTAARRPRALGPLALALAVPAVALAADDIFDTAKLKPLALERILVERAAKAPGVAPEIQARLIEELKLLTGARTGTSLDLAEIRKRPQAKRDMVRRYVAVLREIGRAEAGSFLARAAAKAQAGGEQLPGGRSVEARLKAIAEWIPKALQRKEEEKRAAEKQRSNMDGDATDMKLQKIDAAAAAIRSIEPELGEALARVEYVSKIEAAAQKLEAAEASREAAEALARAASEAVPNATSVSAICDALVVVEIPEAEREAVRNAASSAGGEPLPAPKSRHLFLASDLKFVPDLAGPGGGPAPFRAIVVVSGGAPVLTAFAASGYRFDLRSVVLAGGDTYIENTPMRPGGLAATEGERKKP